MKKRHLDFTTEFLAEQMNHWMMFPPAMAVMSFAGAVGPDLLMWAFAGLFPVLFFLIRVKCQRFWLFLAAHLAVAPLALLFPAADIVSRLLCVFCMLGYLIRSFSRSLKDDAPYTDPAHPLLAAALAAASFFLHRLQGGVQGWEKYYILSLIGFFSLYNIVQYLQHFLDFVTLNQSSAGSLPVSGMLRSGLILVLGYTLFGIAVMALGANIAWLDSALQAIKRLLLALLRAFFSLFLPKESGPEIIPDQEAAPSLGDMPCLPEAEEPFWLWRLLELAIYAALICLLAYCVIRGVRALIRFIRERFSGGLPGHVGEKERAGTDLRERCDPMNPDRRAAGGFSMAFFSPTARIRTIYKKTIRARTPREELRERACVFRLTARENEKLLRLEGMAEIYEQARYSNLKMTGEDVKKMKAACAESKADGFAYLPERRMKDR